MKENVIIEKEKLKKSLEISLELVNQELIDLKKIEKPQFTLRQLEFRRDDAQALINKYKNKKFESYKREILDEVKKKYLHLKSQKEKNDKKFALYEKFITEVREELKRKSIDDLFD